MAKPNGPDLKMYIDKRLAVRLNASRNVVGVLRGFDQFMNIVLDEAVELLVGKEKHDIGMVVSNWCFASCSVGTSSHCRSRAAVFVAGCAR